MTLGVKWTTRWWTALLCIGTTFGVGVLIYPERDGAPAAVAVAAATELRGYPAALRASHRRIAAAERLAAAAPASWLRRGQLAAEHLQHGRLTGNYTSFAKADQAIREAFAIGRGRVGPFMDRAEVSLALHRFEAAERDAVIVEREARHNNNLAQIADLLALRGTLALQRGRYADAERLFAEAIGSARTYAVLARVADYRRHLGRLDEADALYAECLTALPETEAAAEAVAWVHLSRGLLDLERDDFAAALDHYREADTTFPGWWLVEEHIAEASLGLGRTEEAIARYRSVVAETRNPELMGALAAALAEHDPAEAAAWRREARSLFEERHASFPAATAGHAVAFFLEVDHDAARAVELAEANAALRPNGEALLLLARAYGCAGRPLESSQAFDAAEATPHPVHPRELACAP